MKNFLVIFILSSHLLSAQERFFKGIGIFLAGTMSAHHYKNSDYDKRDWDITNYNDAVYYAQPHISAEGFNWGAGIFAEFSKRSDIRWQTELEYVKKSVKEKEVTDHLNGGRAGSFSKNKYTYFQWNNYLKFYNPIGYGAHWYVMPGVRLEYLFSKSASAYTPFSTSFPIIWFSGNIGAGYEFPLFKNFYGFTELHWVPEIIGHRTGSTKVRNRTYELRIGIVWRPKQKKIDDCNAPRYNGPGY